MVGFGGKRVRASEEVMQRIQRREWGCILLDEVDIVPAKMFRNVIGAIPCHCKLGLTATLVREDDRIGDFTFRIGPKLYEANWMDLTQSGYMANVSCVEVWCLMAAGFLVQYHETRGDKILLVSDDVFALRLYTTKLNKSYVYGGMVERERMSLLQSLRNSPLVNVICVSMVGVIIQVSLHFGSRRQEARPHFASESKRDTQVNAFFYTIISTDTNEIYYSNKRQLYLMDQGYTFTVVTELYDQEMFQGAITKNDE